MIASLALLASLQLQAPAPAADNSYLFLVASEGFNQVALIRFGGTGARVERRTLIRLPLVDSANPRAIRVAPDGRYYYVTTAFGFPGGELLKVRIGADSAPVGQPADTMQGREPVGHWPATVQITPDGGYAWITNATPAGDAELSAISVVYLNAMAEVARIITCAAPRGGQLSSDGVHHYSACLRDDALVDIDVPSTKVSRRLSLVSAAQPRCMPVAVALGFDGSHIFVSCQATHDVIEVDAKSWNVSRRIGTGAVSGSLAVSRDGRTLVVAGDSGQGLAIVDLAGGAEAAHVATILALPATAIVMARDPLALQHVALQLARLGATHRAATNLVLSSDDRYAFVTIDAAGESGTVDIVDLATRRVVATVEVGRGPRGIDFWKAEAKRVLN